MTTNLKIKEDVEALAKEYDPEFAKWEAGRQPVGDGWMPIVMETHRRIKEVCPDYKIQQIKEKYGGLRYYCTHDMDDDVEKIIQEAEDKCAETCERCGKPGELRTDQHWILTLCDECDKKRKEERKGADN